MSALGQSVWLPREARDRLLCRRRVALRALLSQLVCSGGSTQLPLCMSMSTCLHCTYNTDVSVTCVHTHASHVGRPQYRTVTTNTKFNRIRILREFRSSIITSLEIGISRKLFSSFLQITQPVVCCFIPSNQCERTHIAAGN